MREKALFLNIKILLHLEEPATPEIQIMKRWCRAKLSPMTAFPVIAVPCLLTGISVSGFLANLVESWQPILPPRQVADSRK